MALEVKPVNRNLHQRVTFMMLEFEDLFVVMGLAALMNMVSHFVSGTVGGIPLSALLQYGVSYAISVPIPIALPSPITGLSPLPTAKSRSAGGIQLTKT